MDTGKPASFANERKADLLLKKDKSAKVLSLDEHTIKTKYVDHNHRLIKLFGSLVINIHINGLIAEKAHFFISENRTRCLLGLDIQPKRGIVTTQVKTTISQIEENEAAKSEESEELQFWKKKFMQKNNDTLNRLRRSKNHKVSTLFTSPLVLIHSFKRRFVESQFISKRRWGQRF